MAFEALYASAGTMAIIPLLYALFCGALKLNGMEYIVPHTVGEFLASPAFWGAAAIALLFAAFYSVVSISGVIYTCECSRQNKKVALRSLVKNAFAISTPVLKPKNWAVILLVLVVIPIMNIGVTPSFLGAITIPDFILEFITYNKALVALFALTCIFLTVLILRWLYAFHFMALEKDSFTQSCKRSAKLGKGHHVKDLLAVILIQIAVFGAVMAVIAILTALFTLLFRISIFSDGRLSVLTSTGMGLLFTFLSLLTVITSTLGMPVCYAVISARYYDYREKQGDPTADIALDAADTVKNRKKGKVLAAIAAVLIVGVTSVLLYHFTRGDIGEAFFAEDIREAVATEGVGVVAHRCGAHFAPENTLAALNKAADMGAKWCEIDVQQCKDGSIIVMHDTNFARTTGKDADSWTMNLDEVKKLDAGSFYGEEYAGEQIPTLDEMIQAAKERGVSLQIEMKPTGNEHDFEKAVADIIVANDYAQNCLIASQNYECLKKAHAYNPDLRTLYIAWIAFGDVTKVEAATDFSVESTWISDTLVETVHDAGKQIFAWTVNTPSVMQRMVDCEIDALVTDEIEDAMEITRENSPLAFADYIIDFFNIPAKENGV